MVDDYSDNHDREVDAFDLDMLRRVTSIPIICVYRMPSDYPHHFVARLWDRNILTPLIAKASTLEELRLKKPPDMMILARDPRDDPIIVENWI